VLTGQEAATQCLQKVIPSVVVSETFWQCKSSTDRYCESSCFQAADKLKQLQAFVAETRDAAEPMWTMTQQSSFMLALLTAVIASKFDQQEYDNHVRDDIIPEHLRIGGSAYEIRCQKFWKWTIEHNLRSVFCAVAARGTIPCKTLLQVPDIMEGNRPSSITPSPYCSLSIHQYLPTL
jgi:hypothetical protein